MEKYAWTAKIKSGKKKEYIERHKNIWQELVKVLKQAGIKNYSIWLNGEILFGYYECEYGIKKATEEQANSPIVEKWNKYMEDVMIMPLDPETGAQPKLIKVFELD